MLTERERLWTLHLLDIAQRHSIAVFWRKSGLHATAHNEGRDAKYVRIPRPVTPFAYLTGLHELGHLCAPHGWWAARIDREATAWQWACEQSLIPVTPRMHRATKRSLDSYLRNGPDWRLRRPKADAPFWAFYETLE